MTTPSLLAKHAEATQLFQEGRLQRCREVVEDLLLALSHEGSGGKGGSSHHPASGRQGESGDTIVVAEEAARHNLFANTLLLLSNCYSAVGSFAEAERLLATCQGYTEENRGCFSPLTPNGGSGASEEMVNVALATVAYSRAAIRLELYRTEEATPKEVVVEADTIFLCEAERRLTDVLGVERLLLADVLHSRGVCCELLSGGNSEGSREPSTGRASLPSSLPRNSTACGSPTTIDLSYLRALEYYSKSMDIRSRYTDAVGVTELKLALTMEHVAHLLRLSAGAEEQGKKEEALRLLEIVGESRRRLLGPRHPLCASTLLAEGALSVELGRYQRAKRVLAAALATVKEVYPANDVRVAEVEYWLSRVS